MFLNKKDGVGVTDEPSFFNENTYKIVAARIKTSPVGPPILYLFSIKNWGLIHPVTCLTPQEKEGHSRMLCISMLCSNDLLFLEG